MAHLCVHRFPVLSSPSQGTMLPIGHIGIFCGSATRLGSRRSLLSRSGLCSAPKLPEGALAEQRSGLTVRLRAPIPSLENSCVESSNLKDPGSLAEALAWPRPAQAIFSWVCARSFQRPVSNVHNKTIAVILSERGPKRSSVWGW